MGQPDKRDVDPEIRNKLIADYLSVDNNGCRVSIATLCNIYKINLKTLYRWVKDAGVYEPRKKKRTKLESARLLREKAAARDYQLGEKVEAIALKHSLPRDCISQLARRAGLPKRSTSGARTRQQVRLRMQLYDKTQLETLKKNWVDPTSSGFNPEKIRPTLRLVLYDAQGCWLLAMVNPDDPDVAYGLCDDGKGHPALKFVSFKQLQETRGPWGLAVERDLYFKPTKSLQAYYDAAKRCGKVVVEQTTGAASV